jgi:hypothetical protein
MGCGRASGDVSVLTTGAPQRVANAEIFLVPATKEFEAAWEQSVHEFQAELAAAMEQYRRAKAKYGVARRPTRSSNASSSVAWDRPFPARMTARRTAWEVTNRYRTWASDAIRHAATLRVRTDAQGHYALPWVRAGTYYLCSIAEVVIPGGGVASATWRVRARIHPWPWSKHLDLSSRNAGWEFTDPPFGL